MTRKTAPYLLRSLDPRQGDRYVLGPELGPSYTELAEENRVLREQLDALRELRDRTQQWEDEVLLRVQAQCRLGQAARVLAAISYAHPEVRPLVEEGRESIWGEGP